VTLLPKVYSKTSVKELMSHMLFDNSGRPIHRIALLDQARVSDVVTQSDLIKSETL